MITSILQGGFGNQLFQYAAAYALAKKTNQDLILDCSFYTHALNQKTPRAFQLDKLNLKEHKVVINHRNLSKIHTIATISQRLPVLRRLFRPSLIIEDTKNCRNFQRELWSNKVCGETVLFGFWQNTKYFSDCKYELKQQFTPSYKLNDEVDSLRKKILNSNSVGVHIRRGDFVQLGWNKDDSYYNTGMALMKKLHPNCVFYIITDDPEWARSKYSDLAHIVDLQTDTKDIDEFFLLSQCRHMLISESTFGWWAAYLNLNDSSTIIVPSDAEGELFDNKWIKI